ncbi:MAG TPA: PDZ domain-containing protein [Chloroflexi bacterium]|nr:PDZ domain-containing protein [Chloroflexota bacterium]
MVEERPPDRDHPEEDPGREKAASSASTPQTWLWSMVAVIVLTSLAAGGIAGFIGGRLYEQSRLDDQTLSFLLGAELAERLDGVVVDYVYPDGPAYYAGLTEGDRLERIGQERIRDLEQARRILSEYEPGDTVLITVERTPWIDQYSVTLGYYGCGIPVVPIEPLPPEPQPIPYPDALGEARLGVYYRMLEEGSPVGVDDGALIVTVWEGGPADMAGLGPGDIIVTVDGIQVSRSNTLERVLDNFTAGETVRLGIIRGGERMTLRLTLGSP